MTKKENNTFFKGALILAVSNILIKIIGAVFKIPLTRIVGDYAMGLYNTAYTYYTILLTIATAGLPIAISKMISESRALSKYSLAKRIFRMALLTCACLGLFALCDSPANSLCLCTGSLGCADSNDIPAMVRKYAEMDRIAFMHIRNVKIMEDGSFEERAHLSNCG